jgi:hypothetical protein
LKLCRVQFINDNKGINCCGRCSAQRFNTQKKPRRVTLLGSDRSEVCEAGCGVDDGQTAASDWTGRFNRRGV